MKKLLFTFALALSVNFLSAQSVGINNDGSAPNASAIVDIKSTTQGMLPPRMTTAQRDAIAGPVQGLVVFNTEKNKLQTYNGTKWINADGSPSAIGEEYGGGIVFYIDETGQHGLIVQNSSPSGLWGCCCAVSSAKMEGLYDGQYNTQAIYIKCTDSGAAKSCADLVHNGYSDWYLPSVDEMKKLAENHSAIPGFFPGVYWTSTEVTGQIAKTVEVPSGSVSQSFYSNTRSYRPIRAF